MENDRVSDFLKRAEARSNDDLLQALEEIRVAISRIKITINPPENRPKIDFVINFPSVLVFLAIAAPYIILIGMALILKFLPLVSKWIQLSS